MVYKNIWECLLLWMFHSGNLITFSVLAYVVFHLSESEENKLSQAKDSSRTTRRSVKRPVPKLDADRYLEKIS